MKKTLYISIAINIFLAVICGYFILKNVGFKTGGSNENSAGTHSEKPYWYYKNYNHWYETKSLYEVMPNDSGEIIFVGNSITYGCDWAELFGNPKIKNRGIGGDNTEGILERLSEITESKPAKVFLNIGTNDIALDMSIEEICANYKKILTQIQSDSPQTKIYIQSVLPVNDNADRSNETIIALNAELKKIADELSLTYINLYDHFLDSDKNLDMTYSLDGLHLNGEGYLIWKSLILNSIME